MLAVRSADDPPVYLFYITPPYMGKPQQSTAHSANFGVGLQEQCRKLGVPCELVYPGAPEAKHVDAMAYLLEMLKEKQDNKKNAAAHWLRHNFGYCFG